MTEDDAIPDDQDDELFEHHRIVADPKQSLIRIDKFLMARLPNVTIPAGLGGLNFYDHTLFLDQAAPGGIVVGWASKWHIGTLKGPSANMLYRTQDTGGNATGLFRQGYGTHIRLTH